MPYIVGGYELQHSVRRKTNYKSYHQLLALALTAHLQSTIHAFLEKAGKTENT
jgi:hypothetical protein